MKNLQILLQNPWIRIAVYLSLFFAFELLLYNYFHGTTGFFLCVFISSITATMLVELPRKSGFYQSVGFHFDGFTLKYFYKAFLILHAQFAVALIIMALVGGGISIAFTSVGNLPGFLFMLFIAACCEEILFRGVIMQALSERTNEPIAAIVMSSIFAIAHGANPGVDTLSFLNIFIAGLLFSFMYFHTHSLMLPIFYHFFWNASELLMLNSPISGLNWDVNIITLANADKVYSSILFGGTFGFESGILATLCLISGFWLIKKFTTFSPYITSKLFVRKYEESGLLMLIKNDN